MIRQVVDVFLERQAAAFWDAAEMRSHSTRDIALAATTVLPLEVVRLDNLNVRRVEEWMRMQNLFCNLSDRNRLSHGLLVVLRCNGWIFLEGNDDERTRQFTLAHEVAHFLHHHQYPLDHAVRKFGPDVLDIFNGHRGPTHRERIVSALARVDLTPYVHLFPRSESPTASLEPRRKAEEQADSLALELLAPAREVVKTLQEQGAIGDYGTCMSTANALLNDIYQLPELIARDYARRLAVAITKGPSMFAPIIMELNISRP